MTTHVLEAELDLNWEASSDGCIFVVCTDKGRKGEEDEEVWESVGIIRNCCVIRVWGWRNR